MTKMKVGFGSALNALRVVGIVLACAGVATVGCGADEDAAPTEDVSATWTGMSTDTSGGVMHPLSFTVIQSGSDAPGLGTVDGTDVVLTGKVSGTKWTGTLATTSGVSIATFELTVNGTSATGIGTSTTDGKTATITLMRDAD